MKTVSYGFNIFKDLIMNIERTKIETFVKCTKKNTLEGIDGFTNFNRMDHFIVSARKYRPETFASVVGQASITGTLISAIQKKQVGHAYLFCGPRGVGKTTCARIFAKTINCMNLGPEAEPCNACESCLSFNESRAFNIHELDAASNNSVEDIRSLTEQVRIPPQVGKYSIYIIDEVHMLSSSAFNAFLKTLEEPPAHAVFILATTEKHKIIPTILSRCQIFDFNRIRVEDIVKYLVYIAKQESVDYEEDAFNVIALKADGAMRDALSIFDQMASFSGKTIRYQDVIENLNILDYEYHFRMTSSCLSGKAGDALLIFDEILSKGFDAQNFLAGFSSHLRDLLVCQDEVALQLLEVGAGIRERYKAQSREVDPEWLYDSLDLLGAAEVSFKTSQNQRLHVELALIRLCRLREDSKKKDPVPGTEPEKPRKEEGRHGEAPVRSGVKTEVQAEPRVANKAGTGEDVRVPAETAKQGETTERADAEQGEPGEETDAPEEEIPEPPVTDPVDETPPEKDLDPGKSERRTGIRASGSGPGTLPSIKDALNGTHKEKNGETPQQEVGKGSLLSASFSQEDLVRNWLAYADTILGERPRMANSLKNHLPTLGDALQIELVLSNSSQLEEFNRDIKPGLCEYLEKALQNNRFIILPVIETKEEKRNSLYTSEEKFDHMLKKNPNLGKLKERFNLDFE